MNTYIFDHVKLTPDKQIPRHTQESWEISYIVTGCGTREIGDRQESFSAGDIVLIPPGIPHCWTFDPQQTDCHHCIENITIIFEETLLDRLIQALPHLNDTIQQLRTYTDAVTFPPHQQERIASLLQRMCHETDIERAASIITLFYYLTEKGHTLEHYEKTNAIRQRLMQVRIYVSCNYQRPISLNEISQHIGMNRSAFCTFFHKHTGQTFVNYLNAYRVNIASNLLKKGQTSVTEACYASGFNDVAYFCRTFRRYKGVAPSAIKKSLNPKNQL